MRQAQCWDIETQSLFDGVYEIEFEKIAGTDSSLVVREAKIGDGDGAFRPPLAMTSITSGGKLRTVTSDLEGSRRWKAQGAQP